jgi:WD40 repeat protein
MTTLQAARIFISYATKDGSEAAAGLRKDLESRDQSLYSVWQDLVRLEGGRDWWSQIEAAIRHPILQHLVLIVTPTALRRPVIRDELRLARRLGKTVIPVRGPGLDDLAKLPRWLGQVLDLSKPEQIETLLRQLAGPSQHNPVPPWPPAPPIDFVPRPQHMRALMADLLDAESSDAIAITAALRGTTGYGKTALALAIGADPRIEDAYYDGVIWIVLGQQSGGIVMPLIVDIIAALGGPRDTFNTPEGAADGLAKALGNKKILLIIDDVWNRADVEPFLKGGPNTTRLITTRDARVLPAQAVEHRIGPMAGGEQGEAWRLLAVGLPLDQVSACKSELVALAKRRHNWPQALRLANGYLRTRLGLSRHTGRRAKGSGRPTSLWISLAIAIAAANTVLDQGGGMGLDPHRLGDAREDEQAYKERHAAVADAMRLNLSVLSEMEQQRFAELAVFPEDVDVPIGIAARLWTETGNLDRHATERLLEALDDASLLHDLDFPADTFRFHDSVREYLIDEARRHGTLVAQHQRMIQAMGDIGGMTNIPTREANYFYRYLPEHLAAAGDRTMLDALLLDPEWMLSKLVHTDINLLILDYRLHSGTPLAFKLGDLLDLTKYTLSRDPYQLLPQLIGRLNPEEEPGTDEFVTKCHRHLMPMDIVPKLPTFSAVGAEMKRMGGHTTGIAAIELLSDRILVSGDESGEIKLWDWVRGEQISSCAPHPFCISDISPIKDNQFAVSYTDGTVCILRTPNCEVERIIKAHNETITCIATDLHNGLITAAHDKSVKRWQLPSGSLSWEIEHACDAIASLGSDGLILGGKSISGRRGEPCENLLVDSVTGRRLQRYVGQNGGVVDITIISKQRFLTASDDGFVRQWDCCKPEPLSELDIGFGEEVHRLHLLTSGLLVASTTGGRIVIADPAKAHIISDFEPGDNVTSDFVALKNGNFLSASGYGSGGVFIRLWDTQRIIRDGLERSDYEVSMREMWEAAPTDDTLKTNNRIVDVVNATHDDEVTGYAALESEYVVSSSWDHTVRVFRTTDMQEVARFDGDVGFRDVRAGPGKGEFMALDARDRVHAFVIVGLEQLLRVRA